MQTSLQAVGGLCGLTGLCTLHAHAGTTTSLGRLLAWYQPMIARQCTVLAGSTNTLDLLKETSFSPKTDTDVGE